MVSYSILIAAASRRKTPAPTGQSPNTSLTAAERMPNTPRTTRRLLSPRRGGRLRAAFGDRIRGVLHKGGFDIRANWLTRAMLTAIGWGTRTRSPLCSTTRLSMAAGRAGCYKRYTNCYHASNRGLRRPLAVTSSYLLLHSVHKLLRGRDFRGAAVRDAIALAWMSIP